MRDYIITVMAPDRIGIVRDISSAITSVNGNITHLSQTVLRGYFTIIVSAELPDERTQLEVKQAIERNGEPGDLEVIVRPYEPGRTDVGCAAEGFRLSMQGEDQKGIIARTTAFLAASGVNVDDFYCYVRDGILLMLAQVSVPITIDIEKLQTGLEQVGTDFGLLVHFQHENIFRATGEVRSVIGLSTDTVC